MKKMLITGFEPFCGETTNPSWDALALLSDVVGDFQLTKLEIPVVFGVAADTVIKRAEEIGADVILCIGQAGGRDAVTPEMIGINLRYATIPDNLGNEPRDEKILNLGENAYFTTLPVRKIADAICEKKIPSKVSYSAGAYVCNDVIYSLLAHFDNTKTRVGFIHVPYSTDQNKQPSMPIETIAEAIKTAIETI